MKNLNDLVYICEEIFDENSEPTKLGNVYNIHFFSGKIWNVYIL